MPEQRHIAQDDGVEYEWRTVVMPDGTEGGMACVPGALNHLSDEEIVAKIRAVLPDLDDG